MSKISYIGIATAAALVALAVAPQVSTAQIASLKAVAGGAQAEPTGYRTCHMKQIVVFQAGGPKKSFERICTQ